MHQEENLQVPIENFRCPNALNSNLTSASTAESSRASGVCGDPPGHIKIYKSTPISWGESSLHSAESSLESLEFGCWESLKSLFIIWQTTSRIFGMSLGFFGILESAKEMIGFPGFQNPTPNHVQINPNQVQHFIGLQDFWSQTTFSNLLLGTFWQSL